MDFFYNNKTLFTLLLATIVFSCAPANDPKISLGSINDNTNNPSNDATVKVDSDGDGLLDDEETACGSDRQIVDTDNDLLNDFAECKTYLTNPTLADTDGDTKGDMQEVIIDHTDPLSPDHDLDTFASVANLPGWPAEADCDDNDANRRPNAADQIGNLVDYNCRPDVTTAQHIFGKGYNVELTLNAAGDGVFVKTYMTVGPSGGPTYEGETLVDPTLPNLADGLPGDGCNTVSNACGINDYNLQPFGVNRQVGYVHESKSWEFCFAHNTANGYVPNNPACTQPLLEGGSIPTSYSLGEGIGFRVEKIGPATFEVTAVGKQNNHNSPTWQYAILVVGE